MATLEHEVTTPLTIRLSRAQRQNLERAAEASGQSLDDFAASALLGAAEDALNGPSPRPASPQADPAGHPLDKIIGIFKDEPLMEDLMERIRADRRLEIAAIESEIAAEERKEQEEARKAGRGVDRVLAGPRHRERHRARERAAPALESGAAPDRRHTWTRRNGPDYPS